MGEASPQIGRERLICGGRVAMGMGVQGDGDGASFMVIVVVMGAQLPEAQVIACEIWIVPSRVTCHELRNWA